MPDIVFTLRPEWPYKEFIPGGSANRYLDNRAKLALVYIRFLAPKRTGTLAGSFRKTGTLNQGPTSAVTTIYSDLDYASYVVLGTQGAIIRPHGKHPMPIPVGIKAKGYGRGGTGPFISRWRVRGQRPNDFLTIAANRAFKGGRWSSF